MSASEGAVFKNKVSGGTHSKYGYNTPMHAAPSQIGQDLKPLSLSLNRMADYSSEILTEGTNNRFLKQEKDILIPFYLLIPNMER